MSTIIQPFFDLFHAAANFILAVFHSLLAFAQGIVDGILQFGHSIVKAILDLTQGVVGFAWANLALLVIAGGGYYVYSIRQGPRTRRNVKG